MNFCLSSTLRSVTASRKCHGSARLLTKCQAVTIVGGGRIGSALQSMAGEDQVLVRRDEPIATQEGPIIVCTRNDVLDSIVDRTPIHRREDLVFIQNGMLDPWLRSRGLEDATQALVYFAVAKMGEAPVDGKTAVNPGGLTAVHGKHAEAFASILHQGGLSCEVLDSEEYKKRMLEKLIWICAFMLTGVHFSGCSVGEVSRNHRTSVEAIISELAKAGEKSLQVTLDQGLSERLCAYADSVSHFPTALKEFEWRNGWFLDISRRELSSGRPDPCPTHTAWLEEAGFPLA